MKHILNKQIKSLILVCILSWMSGTIDLQAQTTIYGPSTANVNDVDYYSVNINDDIFHYTWTVYGGTKSSIQEQSVTVTWTSSGSNSVEYDAEGDWDAYYGSKTVTVSSPPATPPMPTITNNCGNTVLTRTTPPSGETYYWQSSSSGTSIGNSSVSVTRTTGTVYYLRSKKGSVWSSARTITYSITQGTIYYEDADGDTFGDPNVTTISCTGTPAGYVTNSSDSCPENAGPAANNGCPLVNASPDENYIYTIVPQIEVTSISSITNDDNAIRNIQYFDGLGRAKQSIAIQAGNDQKDIVTHIGYDAIGRQKKEFLPYASDNFAGRINPNASTDTQEYYDLAKYESDFPSITQSNINAFSEEGI
ncbi:DUF6443 domain-containing protein [Pontimicrobium sp. SW4]|uniref:DUF6443 domain-containing protein n=1 Tax=Pontimicrobium sp. SW4 TaxID=3153519 RepID=A0AAU7BUW7_9FLAO